MKVKLNVVKIRSLLMLLGEVSGPLKNHEMARKLKDKIAMSPDDQKEAVDKKNENRWNIKWNKEVDLSQDESKLLKKTVKEFEEIVEKDKLKYKEIEFLFEIKDLINNLK